MSTKKKTAPQNPDRATPDEWAALRAQVTALSAALHKASEERDKAVAAHDALRAELRRRASGLPVLARLVDTVLEMHRKDTAGRTILVGVAKLIGELRQFNGTDELPGRDAAAMEDVASYAMGVNAQAVGAYAASDQAPA